MGKKNKKKTKQVTQPPKQNPIPDEVFKPSLNIVLADEIDPELLSKWPKLTNKVPSIFLHRPAYFLKHGKNVMAMGIKLLPLTSYKNYDKITCTTFNDHKMLVQYFEKSQLPYHTFGHPLKRKLKVVITGLPTDIDLNILKEQLISKSIPVIRMHKMYTKDVGKVLPLLVLVVVPHDNDGKNILKLKSVEGKEVKLEPLQVKSIQCHRCQKWGHSQRYCHGQHKCLKCAGDHYYKKCNRDPEKEEPKCANCGQNHTANYKECSYCPDSKNYKLSRQLKELRRQVLRQLVL